MPPTRSTRIHHHIVHSTIDSNGEIGPQHKKVAYLSPWIIFLDFPTQPNATASNDCPIILTSKVPLIARGIMSRNQARDRRTGASVSCGTDRNPHNMCNVAVSNHHQALSEFAEYVEEQQNIRYPTAATTSRQTGEASHGDQHHEELDALFDNLDLADEAPRAPLKQLLLGEDEESLQKLEEAVADRIVEGFGEAVFELGFEYSGESMQLSLEEWNRAYERLVGAAKKIRADCELLITKNVGGDKEAESTASKPGKDAWCSGKILIRQVPARVEDVIETRIAVVGNGGYSLSSGITWMSVMY